MTQPEVEIRRAWRHAVGHDHDRYVDALLIRYGEPHRYYHTATHIMMVVRHVHDVAAMSAIQPSAELVAAALYHDAIYDPRSHDNELRSAALATSDLVELGWSAQQCASVKAMIVATAGHNPPPDSGNPDIGFLLDADLAILGAEPQSYQAYVNGVRAEYYFVDDVHWCSGRGRVLQSFLDLPHIFTTDFMRNEHEHRARANIEAELAGLRASTSAGESVASDD